jgi:hypothetical protein
MDGVCIVSVVIAVSFSGHSASYSVREREKNDDEGQNKFPHRSGQVYMYKQGNI